MESFKALSSVSEMLYDKELCVLAQEQPREAYHLLKEVILGSVSSSAPNMRFPDTGIQMSAAEDGQEAVSAAWRSLFEAHSPDTDIVPVDVRVVITKEPGETDQAYAERTGGKFPYLHFVVEPPNLAF